MNIFKFLLNFFSSKENRIDNLEAKNIMIIENNFNKILEDNLTIVVTDNKGKTIGYISKKEIDNIQ
jgi:hypothetical protein